MESFIYRNPTEILFGKGMIAEIDKTEAFFHSLNMPTRLQDFGIEAEDAARKVGERFASRQSAFGEQGDITADAAAQILRARA